MPWPLTCQHLKVPCVVWIDTSRDLHATGSTLPVFHFAMKLRDPQQAVRWVNLKRFLAERCSTPIWWRRAKFSSSSTARERNLGTECQEVS